MCSADFFNVQKQCTATAMNAENYYTWKTDSSCQFAAVKHPEGNCETDKNKVNFTQL